MCSLSAAYVGGITTKNPEFPGDRKHMKPPGNSSYAFPGLSVIFQLKETSNFLHRCCTSGNLECGGTFWV